MKLTANAKINLYLSVLDRREDGYHNIESVMQAVSLADTVTLDTSPAGEFSVSLSMTDKSLPCDRGNIAYRAAELFMSCLPAPAPSAINIAIEKNIPVAGGLAGGSTDGAAVLRGLNELYGSPFSTDELCRIGARLGADVPFCILGGAAVTLGIGELMTPVASLPDCTVLVVRMHEKISTAEAYRLIDGLPTGARRCPPLSDMTSALARGSLDLVSSAAYNVFEAVLPKNSEVFAVKRLLSEHGAHLSMMSGSGPTVFGLFDDGDAVASAERALRERDFDFALAVPL